MGTLIVSGRRIDVPPGLTIEQAAASAGLHPDSYLYMVGGRPVPMDAPFPEDSEVKAVRVASGG